MLYSEYLQNFAQSAEISNASIRKKIVTLRYTPHIGINIDQQVHDIIEKSKRRDGCDKLSLQILFVYFLALTSLLHRSIPLFYTAGCTSALFHTALVGMCIPTVAIALQVWCLSLTTGSGTCIVVSCTTRI